MVLSPVVGSTTDLPTGAAEQHEHQAHDEQDDSHRPQDRNSQHQAQQHEYDAKCDHVFTLPLPPPSPTEQFVPFGETCDPVMAAVASGRRLDGRARSSAHDSNETPRGTRSDWPIRRSSCEYRPRQVVRSRPRQTTTGRGCRDLRRYPCLFGIVDDLVVDRRSTTSQRSEHHGHRRRFVVDRGSHHAFRHLGPRQRLERPHHRCGLDDRRCPSAPFCQSASGRAGGGFGRHGGDRTIAQERESARYNSRDRYPQPVGTVAKPFVRSDLRRRWYFST